MASNILTVLSNPFVRKLLPILGEIGQELFGDKTPPGSFDVVLDKAKVIAPLIRKMKSVRIADATNRDLVEILGTIDVKLAESDVDLWIAEMQHFADNTEESVANFIFGPRGMEMMKNVLTKGRSGGQEPQPEVLQLTSDPVYNSVTGIFEFQ